MKPYDIYGIYTDLCAHRVTHKDSYDPIEEIIAANIPSNVEFVKSDEAGLLYCVGKTPNTMFISHMDMVDSQAYKYAGKEVSTILHHNDLNIWRNADGNNMGADDKAGIVVLLGLMHADVQGYYLFTRGEESGGIGAKFFVADEKNDKIIDSLEKVISFDRRGTQSIITAQGGSRCCSDEFAIHLAKLLRGYGMFHLPDPTGSYTCSKEFIYRVPECTNVSVGYMNEHRGSETLDMDYLLALIDSCCKIKWQDIPAYKGPELKPLPVRHTYYDDVYGQLPFYGNSGYHYDAIRGIWCSDETKQKTTSLNTESTTLSNKPNPHKPAAPIIESSTIQDIEYSFSDEALMVTVKSKTFKEIFATVAGWDGLTETDIPGDIQYVIMTKEQAECMLIGMTKLAKDIDAEVEDYNTSFKHNKLQEKIKYFAFLSPNIQDDVLDYINDCDRANNGIDPELFNLTTKRPYSIYSVETTHYFY